MRYIMRISYDGSMYSGFQCQKDKVTIQGKIEKALESVFKKHIPIITSGRTDAGVSAISQISHFDIDEELSCNKVRGYLNALLDNDIRILEIVKVDYDFHARYSSKRKTYEYYFYVGHDIIPFYEKFAVNIGYNVNISIMQLACKYFIGVHDFSAFCASNTSVKDKTREIYDAHIDCLDDDLYKFVVTGNGFLYNMVRIIMGTLVDVGMGKKTADEICTVINSKDRKMAGKTMPSKGLVLKKVVY